MRIGVDAMGMRAQPSGIGNYVGRLLEPACLAHPEAEFFLYSNAEVFFPEFKNVSVRVSRPKLKAPVWQNSQLRVQLAADRIDIFWGSNGLIPLRLPDSITTVLTVHDFAYHFAPRSQTLFDRLGRRLFQGASINAADHVVCVSKSTASDMASLFHREADAIIPPPLAPRFRFRNGDDCSVREKFSLPERFILIASTLEPRKNIEHFVRAYLDQRNAGVPLPDLVVAGEKGWLNHGIKRVLERGRISGTVRYLGYVSDTDLSTLLAACEAFFMPSIYEGFGMPVLEAQRCGAPVLHGDHPSMSEASGGVGVSIGTRYPDLCETLRKYALGECPLACRMPHDFPPNAEYWSGLLWENFMLARQRKVSRRRLSVTYP